MIFSVVSLYISLSLILLLDNLVLKWVVYEFSMISAIGILNTSKNSPKVVSMVYYSVSSLSSVVIMFFVVSSWNNLPVMSFMSSSLQMNLVVVAMFLKLSMFPFHNWMIYCYEKSPWGQIFMLSSVMKFIPISFFSHFINLWEVLGIFLLCNSIFISIYASTSFSFKKLLACSTSFNNFLLILMFDLQFKQFALFVILYSASLFFLTSVAGKMSESKIFLIFNSSISSKLFKYWVVVYSMLPLMASFMLKWNLIHEMSKFNNYVSFIYLIYLISNLLLVWKYMTLIKKTMITKKSMTYLKTGTKLDLITFSFTLIFVLMFIAFNFMNNY